MLANPLLVCTDPCTFWELHSSAHHRAGCHEHGNLLHEKKRLLDEAVLLYRLRFALWRHGWLMAWSSFSA